MNKKDELQIVYCADCKYFIKKKINENSCLMGCKKDSKFFDDEPQLLKHKPCYSKKYSSKNNKTK